MKVIAFDRLTGTPMPATPTVDFIPDSAMLPHRKPVFLPEGIGQWVVELYAAARIDRLGKSVAAKFADRYWSEWTIAARMRLADADAPLQALSHGIDYTWIMGDMTQAADGELTIEVTTNDGDTILNESFTLSDIGVDQAIAAISPMITLKTGDIIAPAHWPGMTPVAVGDTVRVSINRTEILKLRIK